jgi:hypothetical protein
MDNGREVGRGDALQAAALLYLSIPEWTKL